MTYIDVDLGNQLMVNVGWGASALGVNIVKVDASRSFTTGASNLKAY